MHALEIAGGAEDCVTALAENNDCAFGRPQSGQRGQQRPGFARFESKRIDDSQTVLGGARLDPWRA